MASLRSYKKSSPAIVIGELSSCYFILHYNTQIEFVKIFQQKKEFFCGKTEFFRASQCKNSETCSPITIIYQQNSSDAIGS